MHMEFLPFRSPCLFHPSLYKVTTYKNYLAKDNIQVKLHILPQGFTISWYIGFQFLHLIYLYNFYYVVIFDEHPLYYKQKGIPFPVSMYNSRAVGKHVSSSPETVWWLCVQPSPGEAEHPSHSLTKPDRGLECRTPIESLDDQCRTEINAKLI